jgi:hypothetical protein
MEKGKYDLEIARLSGGPIYRHLRTQRFSNTKIPIRESDNTLHYPGHYALENWGRFLVLHIYQNGQASPVSGAGYDQNVAQWGTYAVRYVLGPGLLPVYLLKKDPQGGGMNDPQTREGKWESASIRR